MLEEFLGREKVAPIYHKGWVDLMIDEARDTHAKELNKRLKGQRKGGNPWIVILDADGKEIVSSNMEPGGGNCGAPVTPDECAWFGEMMKRSRGGKVSDAELKVMLDDLEEYAKEKRR